jgi:Flp pilus assembly pilin Flp
VFRPVDLVRRLRSTERGQTSTEYVAVLVVAVALAMGVLWLVLSGVLDGIIDDVGSNLSSFSDSALD